MRAIVESYFHTTGVALCVITGVIACMWAALYAFYTVQDWFRKEEES
jgi:hypothetical protein